MLDQRALDTMPLDTRYLVIDPVVDDTITALLTVRALATTPRYRVLTTTPRYRVLTGA